jgi:hypothetical protein
VTPVALLNRPKRFVHLPDVGGNDEPLFRMIVREAAGNVSGRMVDPGRAGSSPEEAIDGLIA